MLTNIRFTRRKEFYYFCLREPYGFIFNSHLNARLTAFALVDNDLVVGFVVFHKLFCSFNIRHNFINRGAKLILPGNDLGDFIVRIGHRDFFCLGFCSFTFFSAFFCTVLIVSRYAFSTSLKVLAWYFLYSPFAFSTAFSWLIVPASSKSFSPVAVRIVSRWSAQSFIFIGTSRSAWRSAKSKYPETICPSARSSFSFR